VGAMGHENMPDETLSPQDIKSERRKKYGLVKEPGNTRVVIISSQSDEKQHPGGNRGHRYYERNHKYDQPDIQLW